MFCLALKSPSLKLDKVELETPKIQLGTRKILSNLESSKPVSRKFSFLDPAPRSPLPTPLLLRPALYLCASAFGVPPVWQD